jgi:small-conductance mechanosensitive channel
LTPRRAPSPGGGATSPLPHPEGDRRFQHVLPLAAAPVKVVLILTVAWVANRLEQGPAGVRVRLVVKTRPLEQWSVARELRARIKAAFDRAGIEVPGQQ